MTPPTPPEKWALHESELRQLVELQYPRYMVRRLLKERGLDVSDSMLKTKLDAMGLKCATRGEKPSKRGGQGKAKARKLSFNSKSNSIADPAEPSSFEPVAPDLPSAFDPVPPGSQGMPSTPQANWGYPPTNPWPLPTNPNLVGESYQSHNPAGAAYGGYVPSASFNLQQSASTMLPPELGNPVLSIDQGTKACEDSLSSSKPLEAPLDSFLWTLISQRSKDAL